jgi:purine nucleosidase
MIPFLIDTDTASDDAVALIMALRHANVHVAAITTVAGNVSAPQATRNALLVAELCNSPVPVYQGATKPLWRELTQAEWFHGHDGLGDRNYPAPQRQPEPAHAVDAIIAAIHDNSDLTIITLGPLTNLALALAKTPEIARKVARCVVMGGNPCCEGNVTPAAEYNFWVDPEAARIVLRSPLPIELVGWQLSRGEAVLNAHDIQRILALNTRLSRFAIECNSAAKEGYRVQTGQDGISLPDPVAMAIALDPSISINESRHLVDVELQGEYTRGATIVDRLNVAHDARNQAAWRQITKPTRVVWQIDNVRWKEALLLSLSL